MKKKFFFYSIFLFFFLFLARGDWLSTDIRLDTGDSPGASASGYPKITYSGDNVYVVWEDRRNGWLDIYFNFSTDGGLSWQISDIRLDTGDSPGVHDSYNSQIACSGENVYVVWNDARNGPRDIYFNYSTDGGATWQTPDIRLDTGDLPGVHGSYSPEIVCSGENVYVVWMDDRNGEFKYDIYFKYSSDGGLSWPTQEIRINTGDTPGTSESWFPKIACSGDNIYVVWEDERNGEYKFDIYFNSSTDGGLNWQTSDIRLDTGDSPGVHTSEVPQMACSGENVYVVWQDYRNGHFPDIYFNYSIDGGLSWQISDIRLDTGDIPGASESWMPHITCFGDSVYAVWFDGRNGGYNFDIYFDYSTDAGETWQSSDIRLDTGDSPGANPSLYPQINCSENNIYVVWQDSRNGRSDIYFNANYSLAYCLLINASEGGTTRPEPGTHKYGEGTEVKVEAFPDEGYRFSHWSGDVKGTDNPITITMDSDISITANFIKEIIRHTLSIESGLGGSTNPAPGNYSYEEGTEVTITAISDTHYRFSHWSGDISSSDNPITIIMDSDKSITANFIRIIYPPSNFTCQKVLNRSLSQAEYINVFSWQSNPNNVDILKYRIYLIEGESKSLLVELDANTFQYWHRRVEKDKQYTYAICAVNDEDREGDPTSVTVQ